MTKDELDQLLYQRGASQNLTNKAAVMERLYAICGIKTPLDVACGFKKRELSDDDINRMIVINEDGTIIFDDKQGNFRRFEELDNGDACYTNNSRQRESLDQPGIYIINNAGIDETFQQNEMSDKDNNFLISRNTPNGRVLVHERRGGSNQINEEVDDGNPVLDFIYYIKCPSRELAREKYTLAKEYISGEYPNAAEWYKERDKLIKAAPPLEERREVDPQDIPTDVVFDAERAAALEERLGEYRREVEGLTEMLKSKDQEIQKVTSEKDKALGALAKTQIMANRMYDILSEIKRSPIGKVFFGRKLQDIPDKNKFLDSGRGLDE